MRAIVAVVVLTGCYDAYTVDDYWNELAAAHCQTMQYCCTSAEFRDWWSEDDGTTFSCFAAHDAPFDADEIRAALRRGSIEFSEERARRCVMALETIACGDFQPAIRYRETYCDPPLLGRMPVGARTCVVDEECESRHCIDGTCVAGAGEGDPCGFDSTCDGGLRCQGGTCGYGREAGASCNGDSQCAADWCKGDGLFSDGTCVRACDGV